MASSAAELKVNDMNQKLVQIISKVKINTDFAYERDKLLAEKAPYLAENCPSILDFAHSSRKWPATYKAGQVETADINGTPDHFIDICDASTFPDKKYDAIICGAVLEHVYDPHQAIKNMYNSLKPGGICFAYTPFFFRYHAPKDLSFQDYYRFSKDALAYMFRDFSEVTLYSSRGRASASAFVYYSNWKYKLEKRIPNLSKWTDKILGGYRSPTDVTGYDIWAVK